VQVEVSIQATGLGRLKIVHTDDGHSFIRVTPVSVQNHEEVPGEPLVKRVFPTEVVDPGESALASRVFLFPPIDSETLGWDVLFTYAIRRRWPFQDFWVFSAPTFVWVPESWVRP
jgi:hypothetical protein